MIRVSNQLEAIEDTGGGTLYRGCKRALDIGISVVVLLLLAPLLIMIGLAIKLDSPGPALFRQRRIGQDGRAFVLWKFRSMRANSDDTVHREYFQRYVQGQPNRIDPHRNKSIYRVVDDPRRTRVGSFLRAFSLDELPQFINVLRGEMSLVGPRPAIPYEVEMYQPWHHQRLKGKPGLTGIWQIRGRGRVPFEEMVRMDLEYINSRSLWLDMKLILQTIPALLRGKLN